MGSDREQELARTATAAASATTAAAPVLGATLGPGDQLVVLTVPPQQRFE